VWGVVGVTRGETRARFFCCVTVDDMTNNEVLQSGGVSAAAVRRERDELLRQHRTFTPLPQDCEKYLEGFRPDGVDDLMWAVAGPIVDEVMRRSQLGSREVFVRACSVVAGFFVWRVTTGQSLSLADALMPVEVDRWAAAHPEWSAQMTNTYRSRLRTVAQTVNVLWPVPPAGASAGHIEPRAPYSSDEITQICRIAVGQRSDTHRRQVCAIVGLCAGAGLASEDLRALRRRDIDDRGDVMFVRVPGRRSRTTVVLAEFEDLVRAGIDGLHPDDLVIKERQTRSNVTGQILDRIERGATDPKIDTYRLRNTWLVTQLGRSVPLNVLLAASGLQGARTLADLISYVDTVDPSTAAAVLRDGGSQ